MKYLSVCSGIEAATVAWKSLGWSPVAFSEIEPFPSAVLAHHYTNTPNWGDMEGFNDWPGANVDVLVGGTPCQSFSVAGLRKGLDDPRGNLALVYLAIAERYRPRWLVWENVPGVLSSDEGRAMGAFLGGMAELGYGFAYRVLDAQFFGLAQRRRRVFVVGCLGDWRLAAAVLFEPSSLRGDPAPSRESGQGIAPFISARTKGGGGLGTDTECDGGLIPEVAATVTAGVPNGGAGHGARSGHAKDSTLIPTTSHTLIAEGFDASEDGSGRGTPLIPSTAMCINAGAMGRQDAETETLVPAPTAFDARQSDVCQYGERTGPLDTLGSTMGVHTGMSVRRLTPRECERLQGFEDDYTLVPYRGGWAKDGPRYKALGNSMAVPVVRWIGRRMELVQKVAA